MHPLQLRIAQRNRQIITLEKQLNQPLH